jgi:hypothetical protein
MSQPTGQTHIDQLAAEIAALQAQLLKEVAAVDRVEGWRYDGAASLESWLVVRLAVSHHTARAWADVATRLPELPGIGAGLAAGRLSFDQVRTVCRYATPEEDVQLAHVAASASVKSLSREARRRERVDASHVKEAREARSFRWWWDGPAHLLRFDGALADQDGSVMVAAIRRIADKAPSDPDTGLAPSIHRRHADALVQMASQSLGDDTDPDRATVVVHVDAEAQRNAEIEGGPVIADDVTRRLACDARIETVIEDDVGVPVGIGRATRRIPPWLDRQLRYRDQGCRFPGCDRERWVHAHHLVHWIDGGPTDLDNLITLCGYHHRLIHEHGWHITGDPNHDVTWIRPDRTPFDPGRTHLQQIVLSASASRLLLAEP